MKSPSGDFEHCKPYVRQKITQLLPVFASASLGDFSRDVELPEKEDEFTEIYVGVQIMLEVIRDKLANLETQKEDSNQAKAKYEALLESIGDGVIAVNEQGRVIFVNRAAEKLFGWKGKTLLGQLWKADIQDEKGKKISFVRRPLQQALKTGKKIVGTYYYTRNDGSLFPAAVTAAPIRLHDRVIGVVEVLRDITKEKAVDRSKTEFVSLASHQLRTPLAAIKWNTETLISQEIGDLNARQLQTVNDIYTSAQRMVQLVDALLNVSRLELGTFAIEPKKMDLAKVAKGVITELNSVISEKQLLVTEEYANNLPSLSADPRLLRIIFQNLLSNAVKYTPEGGAVKLTITLHPPGTQVAGREIAQDSFVVIISDTGLGIPHAQQSQIFNKLFRGDNVREHDTKGTGLGLYVVKSILDQVGGMIWFESQERKGTTFYVCLPASGMVTRSGSKHLV